MSKYWILDENNNPVISDMDGWSDFQNNGCHIVEQTEIGDTFISTVFIGIDHDIFGGVPEIFETMIFGGEHDSYTQRYFTWKEAEEGHQEAVELVSRS